jgi:predicted metal-dependent peptidase
MGDQGCGSGVGGEPAEWEQAIDSQLDRTDRDCDAIAEKVAQDTKKWIASKGVGAGVGGWNRWADQVLGPVKAKWQDRLRKIVSNRIAQIGRKKAVYTRPSRLQSAVGYSAGSPLLSGRKAHVPRILVAIDTSGSVGEKEIGVAMSHIAAILKATRGAEITVCSCDAQIQGWIGGIRAWKQAIKAVKGGGGTLFRPVFDRAASEHIDLIVYVTDGHAADIASLIEPDRCSVVWVLAGSYHVGKSPTGWGDCVISD